MRTGQKQGEGDRRGPNGQSRRGVGSASGDKVGGGGPWEPRQTPSNALARLSTAEAPDAREGEGEGEGEGTAKKAWVLAVYEDADMKEWRFQRT